MSHQERNTWVNLILGLVVNGYVVYHLRGMYAAGLLDGVDAPQVFASFIIWVIIVSIMLIIISTILFSIGFAIVTRQTDGDLVSDERDHMFENRGMAATMFFAAFGFIASFGALAYGWLPVTVFIMIYFSFAIGSLAGDLVRLASYRAGG